MNFNRLVYVDFRCFVHKLRKNLIWIIVSTFIGAVVGGAVALFALEEDNTYQAVATVYSFEEGSYGDTSNGLAALRNYTDIVKSRSVAAKALERIEDTNLTTDDIYNMLSTDDRVVTGSTYVYENPIVLLHIYAEYKNKEDCIAAVNAAADVFVDELNSFLEGDPIKVLDHAVDAEMTYNATKYQVVAVAIGAIMGAFFCIACLLAATMFSRKLNTVRDVKLYSKLPILGVIPDTRE